MIESKFPDDAIKRCAITILYDASLDSRFDIWEIIGSDVINDVKQNSGVNDGNGFSSMHVKKAIGKALCIHLK